VIEAASRQPRALIKLVLTLTGRRRIRDAMRHVGPYDTASHWRRSRRVLDYRDRALAALADIDVILSPASPVPALRHGAAAEVGMMGIYTCVYNVLAGRPAWCVDGRPRGRGERPAGEPRIRASSRARDAERDAAGCRSLSCRGAPWRDHVALAVMAGARACRPGAGPTTADSIAAQAHPLSRRAGRPLRTSASETTGSSGGAGRARRRVTTNATIGVSPAWIKIRSGSVPWPRPSRRRSRRGRRCARRLDADPDRDREPDDARIESVKYVTIATCVLV